MMTVGSKVQSCYASIKGAQAQIEAFAKQTREKESKDVYDEVSKLLLEVIADLEERLNFIAFEEEEYK